MMTLGEFRKATIGMSDDLDLEFYSEKYNDSTRPIRLEFDTQGYIEFIIDDDRWNFQPAPKWTKVEDGLPQKSENYLVVIRERFNKEHWWIDICDIDTDGFAKTWNVREPYYVEAWMPIPKYEGVK